jgi:hypothetical protein
MTRAILAALVLLVALSSELPGAAAQDDYEALIPRAVAAQAAGQYELAHGLFAKAHALAPSARTLRGMGVASFQAGHFVNALNELEAALTHPVKPLDAELLARVDALLARTRAELCLVDLRVTPADAQVILDGWSTTTRRLVLTPGRHSLEVRAPGFTAERRVLEARAGTSEVLELTLAVFVPAALPPVTVVASPGAPPRRDAGHPKLQLAAWITLGGAAALGLTAGALYWTGQRRIDAIADSCRSRPDGTCSAEEKSAQLDHANISALEAGTTSLLVASAALALTSAGLFAWQRLEHKARVQVAITPRALFVSRSF